MSHHPRRHVGFAVPAIALFVLGACGAPTADDAGSAPPSPSPAASATPPTGSSPAETASPSADTTEAGAATDGAPPPPPSVDPADAVEAVELYVAAQDAAGADPANYRPAESMRGFATDRAIADMMRYQQESLDLGLVTGGRVVILRAEPETPDVMDHDEDGVPSTRIRACLDAGDTWLSVGEEEPVSGEGAIPYTAFFTAMHDGTSWKVDEFWTPENSPC